MRKPPPRESLHAFTGKIEEVKSLKVAVLGTDSAVGKRTTAWKIVQGFEGEVIEKGFAGAPGHRAARRAATPARAEDVALIVGNGSYENARGLWGADDMAATSEAIEAAGVDVFTGENLVAAQMTLRF